MDAMEKPGLTFIDLFCGCGGFSLGLEQAGFKELAAIDFDKEAVAVFKANFPDVPRVLERDLTKYKPQQLANLLNTNHVDLIVGGPPCQGFSKVRQVDGSNSGKRLVRDKRRNLYRKFLAYVEFFQPKIFIMENVPGIRSAVGGKFFSRVQAEARRLGYRVHGEVIHAWEFGVPQKRQRQLIIGTLVELPLFTGKLYMSPTHSVQSNSDDRKRMQDMVTLWEAIGDLPPLHAGGGRETREYDLERRRHQLERYGGRYLLDVLEVQKAVQLTAHRARPHLERDLRDFNRLREGEDSKHAIARGEKMEFPYDRDVFKDRYTRQHRDKLCSTIVAHLSKDGLMFIHPTQNRSLTPREAARVQSIPDWFSFPVSRKYQFSLIGNAVPPLVGKALGAGISRWFEYCAYIKTRSPHKTIPVDEVQAIEWLTNVVENSGNGNLGKVAHLEFLRRVACHCLSIWVHPSRQRKG